MAVSNGPAGISSGLILSIDAANLKSYSGSGTAVVNMSNADIVPTLLNGPGFSTDGVGSWTFDGSNDYISIDNALRFFQWTPSGAGSNTLCFELWVKSSDATGYFISKPWNGNGEYNILLTSTGWSIGNSSGGYALTFSTLSTGNWEHIVAIATPTQSAVYRNGNLNAGFSNHGLTVNTPTSGDFNNTIPLAIMTLYPYGSWAGNTGFSIQGSVGLLKIYNRLLSATEIRQSYNSTKSRFRV
jgi:hypothetical protein